MEIVKIFIPEIGAETIAKKDDPADAAIAIAEAKEAFRIVADKFGRGYEAELKAVQNEI